MEQFRMVLAVVLSILVFIIWDYFFMPDPARQIPGQVPQQTEAPQSEYKPEQPQAQVPAPAVNFEQPAAPSIPEKEARTVTVETGLFTAELSEKGAGITNLELKNYKEENTDDSPLKALVSSANNRFGALQTGFAGANLPGMATGHYTMSIDEYMDMGGPVQVRDRQQSVMFSKSFQNGVVVEKRYTFFPESYLIDLDVTVKNGSPGPIRGDLSVFLSRYFGDEGSRFVFEGPSAFINGELIEVKIPKIEKNSRQDGDIGWVAIQNRYFMSALVAATDNKTARMQLFGPVDNVVRAAHVTPDAVIDSQAMQTYSFKAFMGPKSVRTLRAAGHDLGKAVNFGWFDFIARPCLWLMNFIYGVIPSYGIAIIMITILFKIIFWPLGNKSYKSMGEMKKLQPLMTEIREKYKDDKRRMNEEVMNLYKTYKINPLGGCLPILAQIPVFIAFYRMLYQAIELRHAPFFLWIDDLSAPDRLFAFDVSIPLMQPPIGIPVLTIIMGGTMFLQQKLQPAPGDPTQARIMMLMPIMMTVIFVNFPSGLVLYWLVNNVVSIGQQYLVTKQNT